MIDENKKNVFLDTVSIIERESYLNIILRDGDRPLELENCFISIVERPNDIIINCNYIELFSENYISTIKALEQQISSQNKRFIFIYVNEKLENQLKSNKLSQDFVFHTTLLDALEALTKENDDSKANVSFIKSFVNAAVKTIFVQAKTLAKRKNLSMIKENQNILDGEISGVVNIEDSKNPYVIIISFNEATFLELINKMTGENYSEVTDDIKDGAKELMNIIYGQANSVSGIKQEKMPRPPSLIMGSIFPGIESSPDVTLLTNSFESGVNLSLVFESKVGDFSLRIWFPNEQIAQALISN